MTLPYYNKKLAQNFWGVFFESKRHSVAILPDANKLEKRKKEEKYPLKTGERRTFQLDIVQI